MDFLDKVVEYDIAALAVELITLITLLVQRVYRDETGRVSLVVAAIMIVATGSDVVNDLYDTMLIPWMQANPGAVGIDPQGIRVATTTLYYAFRNLTTPALLVFVCTVMGVRHRLAENPKQRAAFFGPIAAVLLLIFSNPLHHLVFVYDDMTVSRGPAIAALYATAVYYSAWAVLVLVRWHAMVSRQKIVALGTMYAINAVAVLVQMVWPNMHVEMFFSSISLMLILGVVVRPEERMDSMAQAASVWSFEDLIQHATLTGRPLNLVFVDIANREKLRQLLGTQMLQNVVREVSADIRADLKGGDVLYYLRNGQFCILTTNQDMRHIESVAREFLTREPAEAVLASYGSSVELRMCLVRVPYDMAETDKIHAFVNRLPFLMPDPGFSTYEELSRQDGFDLTMDLANIVARGIEQRAFKMYYQPIYCVSDGRYHSAEALVRLNDEVYGPVSPALFVPEAEQSGAIVQVGELALDEICRFLSGVDFSTTGLSYIEINLSIEQMVRPSLAGNIVGRLRTSGLDPAHVGIEITETAATYSIQAIAQNVETLAQAGIRFALDDYGTGYSNLSRAISMPFSIIKVDKSLVDELDREDVRSIMADTVTMMKRVGKRVLVEGVETKAQLDALVAMGVDYIQGYYFAMPMPEEEFLAFIAEHNA
ncbi:MAG: EAL domain-containing protein [Coriobacteriales bacterium]|nr:EAL domain-containing protein [Coriobacteriales bacterium]